MEGLVMKVFEKSQRGFSRWREEKEKEGKRDAPF